MENENPLKTWVRRHSPLKSKPLPPPPSQHDSRLDQRALHPLSTNISPSRRDSKGRLRTLLKQKPQPPLPPASPPISRSRSSDHGRRKSMPLISLTTESKSSIRKPTHVRHQSSDLHRLSVRIDDLETQLKEAREQLESATHRASICSIEEKPFRKPDLQIKTRRSNVDEDSHNAAFVANLLHQRDQDQSARVLSCRSSVEIANSNDSEHFQEQIVTSENGKDANDLTPNQHKRKRSQLRQQSWEHLQKHLNERKNSNTPKQQPDPKRLRKDRTKSVNVATYRTKDLPKIPQFPMPDALKARGDFFDLDATHNREQENICPTLDRSQRHFSQPADIVIEQPKPSRHRRSRSQIIDAEDLRQVFTPSESENWVSLDDPPARPTSRKSSGAVSVPRSANPPSPSRRHCASPARLDVVREEFEWDEEIF